VEYGLQKENPEFADVQTFPVCRQAGTIPIVREAKATFIWPLQENVKKAFGATILLFIFWTFCIKYRHFTLTILMFQLKGVYKN
jgi:hypothetical protein